MSIIKADHLTESTAGAGVTVDKILLPTALVDISGAAAGQIKFPSPPNLSVDVHTLDAYEEGTWIPAVYGETTAGTNTYSTLDATYRRIASMIFVRAHIVLATKDAAMAGNIGISGLPFASAVYSNIYMWANALVTVAAVPNGLIIPTSTSFSLWMYNGSAGESRIAAANISATTEIILSGVYHI